MRISKKKLILVLVILLVLLVGFRKFVKTMGECQRVTAGMDEISRILSSYIKANKGRFPESQKELIAKGYIRKAKLNGDDIFEYYIYNPEEPNTELDEKYWHYLYRFEIFKIAYGTKVEALEAKKGKLFYKEAQQEVFLFEAVHNFLLTGCYRRSSMDLYQEMEKYSQENKN